MLSILNGPSWLDVIVMDITGDPPNLMRVITDFDEVEDDGIVYWEEFVFDEEGDWLQYEERVYPHLTDVKKWRQSQRMVKIDLLEEEWGEVLDALREV